MTPPCSNAEIHIGLDKAFEGSQDLSVEIELCTVCKTVLSTKTWKPATPEAAEKIFNDQKLPSERIHEIASKIYREPSTVSFNEIYIARLKADVTAILQVMDEEFKKKNSL